MHFTVSSTADLNALREQLRNGLTDRDVPESDIDDMVLATNEVAVGALATAPSGPNVSLAVRWLVTERPRREIHVTLRASNLDFQLDPADDVRTIVVRAVAGRVDIETLIGGTVIRLRRPVSPPS